MADKKISQLTAAATLTGTEIVPIVQSGVTVSTTAQDIADLAPAPTAAYKELAIKLGYFGSLVTIAKLGDYPDATATYNSVGNYTIDLVTSDIITFTNNIVITSTSQTAGSLCITSGAWNSGSIFNIYQKTTTTGAFTNSDTMTIIIRIYP